MIGESRSRTVAWRRWAPAAALATLGPAVVLLGWVLTYPRLPHRMASDPVIGWSVAVVALTALVGGLHLMPVSAWVRIGIAVIVVPPISWAWAIGLLVLACAANGDCL